MKRVYLLLLLVVFSVGVVNAQVQKTMRGTFIGCAAKEDYTSAFRMMTVDDWEGVARLVASGRCTRLEKGTTVYMEDSTFTGLIRVRPRGETRSWWTGVEQRGPSPTHRSARRTPPPRKPGAPAP